MRRLALCVCVINRPSTYVRSLLIGDGDAAGLFITVFLIYRFPQMSYINVIKYETSRSPVFFLHLHITLTALAFSLLQVFK